MANLELPFTEIPLGVVEAPEEEEPDEPDELEPEPEPEPEVRVGGREQSGTGQNVRRQQIRNT